MRFCNWLDLCKVLGFKNENIATIFHQNGQKKAEGNADRWGLDSRGDGLWIFWDETGKIITAKSYKDGQVVKGSDEYWNSNGEPVDTYKKAEAE